MKFCGLFNIDRVGLLRCFEGAKKYPFFVDVNAGPVNIVPPVIVYTLKPSSIVLPAFAILGIPQRVCCADITPPVVVLNPIDVVNLIFWPLARHIEPCEAMRWAQKTIKTDYGVPSGLCRPG